MRARGPESCSSPSTRSASSIVTFPPNECAQAPVTGSDGQTLSRELERDVTAHVALRGVEPNGRALEKKTRSRQFITHCGSHAKRAQARVPAFHDIAA